MTAPKSPELDSGVVSALRLLFWGVTNMDTMVSSLVARVCSDSLIPLPHHRWPHLVGKSAPRTLTTHRKSSAASCVDISKAQRVHVPPALGTAIPAGV